jgi:hypothetical protein
MTVDITEALRCYFGADARGGIMPGGKKERVLERYGSDAPAVLLVIERALEGLLDLSDDVWLAGSLIASGEVAEKRARTRRPDFDDVVCKAIGNYVAYTCR